MRLPILAALTVLATALPAAPAAAAGCLDKRLDFKGTAHEAEFTGGGGPLGKRKLTVGDAVEGQLVPGTVYHVPAGKTLTVEFGGYTYKVSERAVFMPQCTYDSPSTLYFRLLERKVSVSGPKFSGNPKAYVITPEAQFLPLPGKPSYTVKRTVTNRMKTTRSTVSVNDGGSNMFVKGNGPNGGKIPCQAGKSVTMFLNGRYRNG